MKPEQLQSLQPDAQEKAVLEVIRLAYKVNHLSLADAYIELSPTVMKLEVVRYFQNVPVINTTLSIGGPATENLLLVMRIEAVAAQLRKILEDGTAPRGGAA